MEKIGPSAGLIKDGLPWDHKSYMERIDVLEKKQKEFEKLPWPAEPHEELSRAMLQQYSFLRSTIERVIQDFVLNGTIRRFEDYIRVDNIKLLVGFEEDEAISICTLYRRCHSLVEAHDPSSAKDALPPTAKELGNDIFELKTIIKKIKDRRKSQGIT